MNPQENADIAVLKSEMKSLKDAALRIEEKLDKQNEVYVSKGEFNEFKQRWFLSHTLAAVMGAVISGILVKWIK